MCMVILALLVCCVTSLRLVRHDYYGLEVIDNTAQAQSLKGLNKCKQECLNMKHNFPLSFRYHRLILRQPYGKAKYFLGQCQAKVMTQEYGAWTQVKQYIEATNLFGDRDTKNKVQMQLWSDFYEKCERQTLELTEEDIESLDLTRVHSDFYYYDDGSFQNSMPFDDIASMMRALQGRIPAL